MPDISFEIVYALKQPHDKRQLLQVSDAEWIVRVIAHETVALRICLPGYVPHSDIANKLIGLCGSLYLGTITGSLPPSALIRQQAEDAYNHAYRPFFERVTKRLVDSLGAAATPP